MDRLFALAEISPIAGGGNCRLALTDEDKLGRDLVVGWMRDLSMDVQMDAIGNVIGTWQVGSGLPVMTGSHIDTVRTGGKYDGNYGVLAGLEVVETLQREGFSPQRPLSVAIFTDEEGARFAPDMLGSLVYVGGLPLEEDLVMSSLASATRGPSRVLEWHRTLSSNYILSKGPCLKPITSGSARLPGCRASLGKR